MQNKCIHFCLTLDKICTISHEEFKDFNWLPVSTRLEQLGLSTRLKHFFQSYNLILIDIIIASACNPKSFAIAIIFFSFFFTVNLDELMKVTC